MTKPASFKPTLIIHGGAGNIQRSKLPPDLYAAHHASLQSYLRSTHAFLKNGGTALDAAVHAVSLLEDDPLFNCGRGSVFTTAGTIEMEASIMVTSVHPDPAQPGAIKRGAGVMGLRNVRHPIRLARESLLRSGVAADGSPVDDGGSMHSQLVAPYVETLARDWGLEVCSDEWFFTQKRWDEHIRGLKGEEEPVFLTQGTVGCVCLDQWGNLAVATSTGGLTNKLPGRIGDTPTLGAGFWAEAWDEIVSGGAEAVSEDSSVGGLLRNARNWLGDCIPSFLRDQALPSYSPLSGDCSSRQLDLGFEKGCHSYQPSAQYSHRRAIAVSGTGNGDSFLRVAAARTVAAMLRFSPPGRFPSGLADAVTAVTGPGGELQRSAGSRWKKTGEGEGGIIGIEAEIFPVNRESDVKLHRGKVVFDFNCGGMWRAWVEEDTAGNEVEKIMVFREQYQ